MARSQWSSHEVATFLRTGGGGAVPVHHGPPHHHGVGRADQDGLRQRGRLRGEGRRGATASRTATTVHRAAARASPRRWRWRGGRWRGRGASLRTPPRLASPHHAEAHPAGHGLATRPQCSHRPSPTQEYAETDHPISLDCRVKAGAECCNYTECTWGKDANGDNGTRPRASATQRATHMGIGYLSTCAFCNWPPHQVPRRQRVLRPQRVLRLRRGLRLRRVLRRRRVLRLR